MRVTIAEGARVFPLWFGYLLVQHVCREDSVYISHSTCCWQTCMCEWRGVAVWMSTSVEGIWMWFIYPEKMRVVSMNEKGGGVSCAQTLCLLESDWVTLLWWLDHSGKKGSGGGGCLYPRILHILIKQQGSSLCLLCYVNTKIEATS